MVLHGLASTSSALCTICLFIFNLLPASIQLIPVSSYKVIPLITTSRIVPRYRIPGGGNSRAPSNFMTVGYSKVQTAVLPGSDGLGVCHGVIGLLGSLPVVAVW